MVEDTFHHRDDEPGFVVCWRYKYKFESGQYDEEMTYGQARQRVAQLHEKHPDMTFWPKKKHVTPAFYNPDAH